MPPVLTKNDLDAMDQRLGFKQEITLTRDEYKELLRVYAPTLEKKRDYDDSDDSDDNDD